MIDPPVESVGVSVYTVPTDGPEADGTLAWDSTTMVLVRAGGVTSLGWTYGPAAYTVKQAVRVMGEAADLDVRWLEEPVSSDDLHGLRAVRDAVLPKVAAGEYGYDLTRPA